MTAGRPTPGPTIAILTGGEPLLRDDVYEIARDGANRGLRVALATCGATLDATAATRLRDSGVSRISLSLDGPDASTHDAMREVPGSFDAVMRAADVASTAGLEFQFNTTLTRLNVHALDDIHRIAVERGAAVHDVFFLVPTGRARAMKDSALSPEQQEEALAWIAGPAGTSPVHVKPTCAPQYARVGRAKAVGDGRPPSGCIGGTGFAFVSHVGDVQTCGFLERSAGNIRGASFASIWRDSAFLKEIRDTDAFIGPCGMCRYRRSCRGCRARAYAMAGSYMASDPVCRYDPARDAEADDD
jgi:radical SAM protein with 4Fe4S-binding SPASM domain